MAEEQKDIDTSTRSTRTSRPLTPEQRERKQERFLKAYCETGNIKYSCKLAGINRQTFYNWRDSDEAFKAQLPDAVEDAHDTLEFLAFEQARGIKEPAVSMGRIVYEEVPVLDANGDPELDKYDKPKMKRGKMVMVKKYSPTVLITLLKANMPDKYKDRSTQEVTGKDGGPIEFTTDWGGGALPEEDESEA